MSALLPGSLTFRGDCTQFKGRILGPTTYGKHVVVETVLYSAETDSTTARCRVFTEDERGWRDEFGQLWLAPGGKR